MDFGVGVLPFESTENNTELVKLAENLGFAYAWVFDAQLHRDTYVELALCAINTSRIRLGVGPTNPVTRHPALTAAAVASIDVLSEGRAILGFGRGHAILIPLRLRPPSIKAIKEGVEVIRKLLKGETVDYESETIKLKGARLRFKAKGDVPVYIPASGPKMLRVAGQIADGVIMHAGVTTKCLKFMIDKVKEGAKDSDRKLDKINLVSWLFCSISEDRRTAFDAVKSYVAALLSTSPYLADLAEVNSNDVHRVIEAYSRATFYAEAHDAAKLVTDDMVEKFALAGTSEDCIKKVENIQKEGFKTVSVYPIGKDRKYVLKTFGQEVMPHFK